MVSQSPSPILGKSVQPLVLGIEVCIGALALCERVRKVVGNSWPGRIVEIRWAPGGTEESKEGGH